MPSFQEVLNAGQQAAPFAAAAVGGVLLEKFLKVSSFLLSFFASKPDVLPALLEVVKDVVQKQSDLQADLLALLQAIKAQNAAAQKSAG